MKENNLILASGSPRRRELLSLYTTDFTVCVSDFDPEKLYNLFPEMKDHHILAIMPTGYPAEDAKPAKWHTDSKDITEMVTYL